MGNNHSQYYNDRLRKVVIVGPAESGKTTLLNLLDCDNYDIDEVGSGQPYVPTDKFSNS